MSEERLSRLIEEARGLERGREKLERMEEALRIAETLGRSAQANWIRNSVVETSVFSGNPDRAVTHFAGILQAADARPGQTDWRDVLFRYRWVLNAALEFPTIPRQRLAEMVEDFGRRTQQHGFSHRNTLHLRAYFHWTIGELAEAEAIDREWQFLPRDPLAICHACEENERLVFRSQYERYAEAAALADPYLKGRMTCASVPQATFAELALVNLGLGRFDEARRVADRGYRMSSRDRSLLTEMGDYLICAARLERMTYGMTLFNRHFLWCHESTSPKDRLCFLRGATTFLMRLVEGPTSAATEEPAGSPGAAEPVPAAAGGTSRRRRMAIPAGHPLYASDGRYNPRDVLAWCLAETERLTVAFDARNGNNFHRKRWETVQQLAGVASTG